jgi:hypothetical protein
LPPIVRKILVRGFLGLLGLVVVVYVIDAIQVRIRLAMGGPGKAYDTVTVLYAAGLKGGKYEIYSDEPDAETCSRSLFPQIGYAPCWYLRQESMKMLD